jgi:UDP-glucose 4-epimerase
MKIFYGKKALITGGCGFIGSSLARRLISLGANVTIIDSLIPSYGGNLRNISDIRDQVWLNISDIRDSNAMAFFIQGQDFLFNLAGQTSHIDSMTDPYTDLEINSKAQLSILETAKQYNPGIRIVFTSTRQLYGKPQYLPVDEKHPIVPVDVNGINKLAGEWYHLLYNNVYGIKSTCLRLTNTYGPGMRVKDARQTFLGVWIKQILSDEKVQVFGDGKQLRDFNYVDDVVEAILLASIRDRAIGEVINLGSEEVIGLADLAIMMIQANGSGQWGLMPFPAERKSIDIGDFYGNWKKANSMLGWSPKIGLSEGLKRSIDYYKRNGSFYW